MINKHIRIFQHHQQSSIYKLKQRDITTHVSEGPKEKIPNAVEDEEKLDHSYTAGRNVKLYSHSRK